MNLEQYLVKKLGLFLLTVKFRPYFTGKLDTEDELYNEITIRTDKYPYVGFNESEIASIELTQDGIIK